MLISGLQSLSFHSSHKTTDPMVNMKKYLQFINVGNFWVQYADESTASELRQIQNKLNRKPLAPNTASPVVDMLVAAPYADATGTKMYRARITRIISNEMLEVSIQIYSLKFIQYRI